MGDPFSRKDNPCDHYFNVDCGDRLELQVPKGTSDLCPRLNGFYAHPDPAVCTKFYSCVEGDAEEYTCSPGLWFDDYKGVCNWPEDCAKFYICLNGVTPRAQGCELGLVYNDITKQCDGPENVPECKDYYAFLDDEDNANAVEN